MINRRKFMFRLVTTSSVVIAGCLGDDDNNGSDSMEMTSGRSQTATVEQYWNGWDESDIDKMNEVVHPDSEIYPIREDDITDESITINEIEELTVREVARGFEGIDEDEEIPEELIRTIDQDAEDQIASVGGEDYSIVTYEIVYDEIEPSSGAHLLAKSEEWLIIDNSYTAPVPDI